MFKQSEFLANMNQLLIHPAFLISTLIAISIWIIDPAVDALLSKELSFLEQLLQPSAIEIFYLLTFSSIIILTGSLSTFFYLLLKNQDQRFRQEQQLLKSIIESEPECVKTVSAEGCLLSMNPAGLELIEAESFEAIRGLSVYDLIAPEHKQQFKTFHQQVIAGDAKQMQFDLIGLKGTRKTMETHAVPLLGENNEDTIHLAITRDITESKRMSNKLIYQASHDILTGLVNRGEFKNRLSQSLFRSSTDQSKHAIFFMDLDQFKVINDTCGHLAGDELLKKTAGIIRSQLRQQDTVARLGGDEFAVLLNYCNSTEAEQLANTLRLKIEALDFFWEGRIFKITCSIGVAIIDYTTADIEEALKNADAACLVAKEKGRNRVYLHDADDEATLKKQGEMQWISRIHDGIANNRFYLFAQLIEGLDKNQLKHHAEILIRYRDNSGTIVPPGAFLPAAERYGVMVKIDRYVVESTLSYLSENPTLLESIDTFCINLSGQSIADEDFLNFVIAQLAVNSSLAKNICFEITETAAISDLSSAHDFILQVKKFGCRFSLDDFGSGLSSFAYLKNLPVDFVKIDGEFVKDIAEEELDLAMIRSINEIAQLMGKQTVAEFVESEAIRSLLINIGVNYAQGFGIHKPQAIEELQADLLKQKIAKAS